MNRRERRRLAAELRTMARSGMRLAHIGRLEAGWTCDCICCQLLRAGVCLQCAAEIHADILDRDTPGEMTVQVCATCAEAVQQFFCGG